MTIALAVREPIGTLTTTSAHDAYLMTLATSSRRTMTTALSLAAQNWPDGEGINYAALLQMRDRLMETHSIATVNKTLSAVRGVAKQAWLLGELSHEAYARLAQVKNIKQTTLPSGRMLTTAEIDALVTSQPQTPNGMRDAAMLATLAGCGLRRAELVGLTLADYDADDGTLTVAGKGRKERIAHLPPGADAYMRDWLTIRGGTAGPLFYASRKGGAIVTGKGLSTQAIFNRCATWATRAGIQAFTPHDLRRSFCSVMLDLGNDLSIVSKMAGHSLTSTTARYDRRPLAARRTAADGFRIRYEKRTLA